MLPAGLLREFPGALSRADLFLLTRCPDEGGPRAPNLPGPVFRSRHRLSDRALSQQGTALLLKSLCGKKGVAFAGIADPETFFRQLDDCGLCLTETVAFADHVSYGADVLDRLKRAATHADFLVTTEKDAVKLADADLGLPLYQVPLVLDIEQNDEMMSRIDALTKQENLMAVADRLLEILACPKCKGEIRYEAERDEIVCDACRLIYPVRDGIPVMLIDEATSF